MNRQRSSSVRQTVLLLLCLAGASACHAQAPAGDTVYHLRGTVIDGMTGKPLARALVKSGDQRLATMTGTDGKFALDISVPERPAAEGNTFRGFGGSVFLTAQKPGYLILQNRLALIPLNDTLSNTPVEITLMPAATITGRISSAATDSVSGVRVNLLWHRVQDGQRFWIPAGAAVTNAHGDFRISNLTPGEYTVLTSQWAGDQPLPAQRDVITQQYPPTLYGDVRNLAGSPKLHLHYGDVTRVEIHLHLVTYYPVAVPVTSLSANQSINVRLAGPENFASTPLRYNRAENAVEGSLPSGDYTLILSNSAPGPQQGVATVPIHVDSSPIRTAAVALSPPASIQVRVHPQFTKQDDSADLLAQGSARLPPSGSSRTPPQPQLVQLILRSDEGNGGYVSHPSSNGDLVLDNVPPGRYFMQEPTFRGYISSITSGGIDLFDHPLVVNPSGAPDPIDVTLRDDGATLTGTVNPGEVSLLPTSFIALLPTESSGRYTQTFAGPDGKFSLANIRPGSYRVLAFRGQPLQLPYRDAEAMHRYDSKGVTITLTADQSQQVDVPLLDTPEDD